MRLVQELHGNAVVWFRCRALCAGALGAVVRYTDQTLYYYCKIDRANARVQIGKVINSVNTPLGQWNFPTGTTYKANQSFTMACYVNATYLTATVSTSCCAV